MDDPDSVRNPGTNKVLNAVQMPKSRIEEYFKLFASYDRAQLKIPANILYEVWIIRISLLGMRIETRVEVQNFSLAETLSNDHR